MKTGPRIPEGPAMKKLAESNIWTHFLSGMGPLYKAKLVSNPRLVPRFHIQGPTFQTLQPFVINISTCILSMLF